MAHRLLYIILFSLLPFCGYGQVYDTISRFNQPITMDSFVVKSGFNTKTFIKKVQNDTTFFKAFKSLHFVPYKAINNISAYDKKGQRSAALYSITHQVIDKNCRITKVDVENTSGDFYDRHGEYNYYTAALYAFLFFAKEPICNESDIVEGSLKQCGKGKMEKSKYELKQLIFNPGSKVSGVPFMGDRASVFDDEEAVKYDFKISIESHDGQDCYVFRILPKQGYEHKVLYNEMTTWFRRSDYSIIARDYSLSYHTLVYDFDVKMKVRTRQVGGKLLPYKIDYDGNWHVFMKNRERVKFTCDIEY